MGLETFASDQHHAVTELAMDTLRVQLLEDVLKMSRELHFVPLKSVLGYTKEVLIK